MALDEILVSIFDGFKPDALFVRARRAGARTQVFADDDVPFGGPPEVLTMVQEFPEQKERGTKRKSPAETERP